MPAREPVHSCHRLQDPTGDRPTDHACDGNPGHEQRDDRGPSVGRVPVGQIQDHPGEKTRLRDTQQKAQDVKSCRRSHEQHRGRDHRPGQHHARDPQARPDAVQHDVARDFEEEVADEENAGAQAVDRLAEPQIAQHLQFREADVHPIEIGRDVAGEQQRDQAPGDAGVEACLRHVLRNNAENAGAHRCLLDHNAA